MRKAVPIKVIATLYYKNYNKKVEISNDLIDKEEDIIVSSKD